MLSRASERLTPGRTGDRTSGAVLAVVVQGAFLLLLVTMHTAAVPPRNPAPETLLMLRSLPRPAPPPPAAASSRALRPVTPLIIPDVPSVAPPVLAPPSGIAGFGRSLFGCAPEHYADLPPDERAHCPKPGEGLAINQPPDPLNPPKSRAKDEALWQEQWAEDHWVPAACPLGDPGAVAHCLLQQSIAENRRRQAAWQKIADDKAARLQEPKRPLPDIGVRRN